MVTVNGAAPVDISGTNATTVLSDSRAIVMVVVPSVAGNVAGTVTPVTMARNTVPGRTVSTGTLSASGVGAVTVMVAVAVRAGSAAAAAVIVATPAPTPVTSPLLETVATVEADVDQFTVVLVVPLTAAANCCVPPTISVAEPGAIAIATVDPIGVVGAGAGADASPPPPHATARRSDAIDATIVRALTRIRQRRGVGDIIDIIEE